MPVRGFNRSLIAPPSAKAKSFRLTIVVNFAVNLQPRLLLIRREIIQYFHNIADHFLANTADQSRSFRCDANHDFAAVISRSRAHHVAKIFQPCDQTAGGSGGVAHFLRDLRHAEHLFPIEISEKKELRERNVARRQFLAQAQHKTALHFQNDVGKPFRIRTNLIDRSSCKGGNQPRVQGGKTRNARVACQSCSRSKGTTACAAVGSKLDGCCLRRRYGEPRGSRHSFGKTQTDLRTSKCNSTSPIPDLNINNLIGLQRLADRNPQQRIRLAQTEKRMRFLAANRSKPSISQLAADVMRPLTVVR